MPEFGRIEESKVDKPWGYELRWAITDRYLGKVLHLNKGESLSLQYHRQKDECQYVIKGSIDMEVGGADGTLLAELLANRPECRGIVFDLPNVVAKATETLATVGLSNRTTVVGGDFFEHVLTADIYVMSIILHD